jgi:hypothetical protein
MRKKQADLEQMADSIIDLVLESTYVDYHHIPSSVDLRNLPIAIRKREFLIKEIVKELERVRIEGEIKGINWCEKQIIDG